MVSALIVLVCRRRASGCGVPHQQRLEREAWASLQANLARWPFPCFQSRRATTAEALETIRGLSSRAVVLQARKPAFCRVPIPGRNVSAGVLRSSVAALQQLPQPPLPPARISQAFGAGLEAWPQAWLQPQQPNPTPERQRMPSHRSAFPLLRR